ncbi:sulfotransferase 1C4-like [Bradysia coprophila]|uniref:sulfotransferase 1C4-like n=1 Tax=Bradysia coprophila TaxID=38358 RepID=UPI00187DAB13|nr:sulfotransferase 1C4-like [Bradysia coprophila]
MELNGSVGSKNYKKLPFEIVSIDEASKERVLLYFKGPFAGLLQVGPEKWIMPKQYSQCAEKLYNFEARSDDIWITTYPRSGTTWTQEMMWLLCNDLNYEAAKETVLGARFPFFEMNALMVDENSSDDETVRLKKFLPPSPLDVLPEMTSPRFIKTHLPIKLMPHDVLSKGCKIVYVARNPKDVAVSYYHFVKNPAFSYTGNFEEFADFFIDNLVIWGSHLEHVKDAWNRRNDSNVLFLFYEDLLIDLENSLKKLASFLGRPLCDKDLPDLMEHLNIDNFKDNNSVNMKDVMEKGGSKWSFIRRGRIGGNQEMTAEISKKFDEWTDEQLKGTGIRFNC